MKLGVAYYRESTPAQGKPWRNGLINQKATVRAFAKKNKIRIVKEFVELKSGGNDKRSLIKEAIEYCKKIGATLLIDKQDRLARSVLFIALLIENKVDYIAVDDPHADEFRRYIKAVFDHYERKKKSERAIATAQALKAKGVKLGTDGKKLSRYYKKARRVLDKRVCLKVRRINNRGFHTVRSITDELNRLRVATFRGEGRKWHISIVYALMVRNKIKWHKIKNKTYEH